MNRSDNTRTIAARFIRAVSQGDRAALDALLAPDAEWWVLGKGHLDRRAFMAVQDPDRAAPVSARRTVLSVTIEDNRAAVEIDVEVNWPDGVYRNRCHHLITVEGDRIASFREYLDPSASLGFFKPVPTVASG